MTKGSDLLVAALENEGVERIFGIPGEENLDVVESLRRSSIQLVLTRHEQAAGFMAATFGRLTGKPGVCITTLGPGALNLTTAAAYAHLGAMPMVMITGPLVEMRLDELVNTKRLPASALASTSSAPDSMKGKRPLSSVLRLV